MTRLQLFSEPFAKTGNIAAEGFRQLLGRPALGLLQTVIREGLQNVLDASRGTSGPKVLIRLRTLSDDQRIALANQVFAERPLADETRADLDASIAKSNLRVLDLCDFDTEGLAGPTRADVAYGAHEPHNFINFLRNVGAARDTHQGGGTYGYGKSSLYAMSACSTILVDTQTHWAGRSERRLMACHLGAAFDASVSGRQLRRFTGRHWWGVLDGSDSVEPLTDDTASALAVSLGLPDRTERHTGTSIMIVDPEIGDNDPNSIIEDVIELVLWNFWPRMTSSVPPNRKLTVEVELDGTRKSVPAPEDFPPLDLFAAAMADHRALGPDLEPIWCRKPRRQVGNLVVKKGLSAQRRGPATRDTSIIPRQASHIALMRPVELVVKYIAGEPLPDRRFEWAGVFICSEDDDIEEAFALSEPPTHDDWVYDNLPKGNTKTFVRVALARLNEIARPGSGQAIQAEAQSVDGPSLAATASTMGAFLDKVSATGPGKSTPGPGSPSARKTLAISRPRFVGLQLWDDGHPVARFQADLQNDGSDEQLHVIAEPHLIIDGGLTATGDLPGWFALSVSDISLGDVRKSPFGPWIHVGYLGGAVEFLVPTVPGAAVGLKLRLKSGSPE